MNRFPDGVVANGGAGYPETGLHTTPLALARLGWLLANEGRWAGRPLLSADYVRAATRPRVAPETRPFEENAWYAVLPGRYGLNWWTNGVNAQGKRLWPNAPAEAFVAQGNRNNICIVIPSWDLVRVRGGGDAAIDVGRYDEVLQLLHEAGVGRNDRAQAGRDSQSKAEAGGKARS